MFIHKEATKSFERDLSGRYVSGVMTGMLNLPEKEESVSRDHEKNMRRYRAHLITFSVLAVLANIAMLVWPPVYGAFQWFAVNAISGMLMYDAANKYSMSKQGIGYQKGRESIRNIRMLRNQ